MRRNKPRNVLITQSLFFLNAAIWLSFGIYSMIRLGEGQNISLITYWIITILIFANTLAMFVSALWLGRQSKWAFLFALSVLIVNILLTFTDQVGIFDITTAILDFILLGLLLYNRNSYL